MHPSRRYVLISPCRNEAEYAQNTIDSIARQTLLPEKWIIVDDGSTDETPRILAEAAQKYPFIKVVHRPNRGKRSVGPGVIDSFYAGYEALGDDNYDYLCKLDMDLDIPKSYFETMILQMEANPRIGTCSGKPYFYSSNGQLTKETCPRQLVSEKCGDEMSVGMIKFYRRICFEQIGGFVREVMWDGIDCHRCRMLGWIACSWDDPEIRFIHLRPMGSSDKNILVGRMRHGAGQYFMGTDLAYITASALFRMKHPPVVIGSIAMLVGYLRSMVTGKKRYEDPEFRKFLRDYQWKCLFKGKSRATQEVNSLQLSLWKQLRDV